MHIVWNHLLDFYFKGLVMQHIYKSLLHERMNAHTRYSIPLLLPIGLMKMDLSNLFPDTRTRTSQPVPCVVSSSSPLSPLLFRSSAVRFAPYNGSVRPDAPPDQEVKRVRNLSLSPTRPSPDIRTTALIIWHFNIVLPFLGKIKGVIKRVKGDGVADQ